MKIFFKILFYGIFYIFLFFAVVVVVIPKDKVYYTLADQLAKKDIKIVAKDQKFNILDIELNDVDIYLSGSKIASLDTLQISPWRCEASLISFKNALKTIVPNIKRVTVTTKIDNFSTIVGGFGKVESSFDLSNKKIVTIANIPDKTIKKYNSLFSQFKKTPKGYIYEYNF